jgi:hypothetical protein
LIIDWFSQGILARLMANSDKGCKDEEPTRRMKAEAIRRNRNFAEKNLRIRKQTKHRKKWMSRQ